VALGAERMVVVVPDPPLVRAPARKLQMISLAAASAAAFSANFFDNWALDDYYLTFILIALTHE
jgi:hypothetical protein